MSTAPNRASGGYYRYISPHRRYLYPEGRGYSSYGARSGGSMGNCCSRVRGGFTPGRNGATNGGLPLRDYDEAALADILEVTSVDLFIKTNVREHRTSRFNVVKSANPGLVVRRGAAFSIKINFNRRYNINKDLVNLIYIIKDYKYPSYSQNTHISLPITGVDDHGTHGWSAKVTKMDEKGMIVDVLTAADSIIGVWQLEIDTKKKTERGLNTVNRIYKVKEPMYLLFNPWNYKDKVYLNREEYRNEYVLNDSGLQFRGSTNLIKPSPWNYGQYEENVLECCFYLLSNVGKLPIVERSNPVLVARHVATIVNSNDDNGVVRGNWSGTYTNGTPPTAWMGSKKILQQYYKTKKPVSFGQCWIYAGVCTTVCRALGIPCRDVTNYDSAHDTNCSLTVDYFYDKDDNRFYRDNPDSVWNFHVWNEVWMDRPDLEPDNYGGWQVIDATPMEMSFNNLVCCGPTSVKAIKKGEILKHYDAKFVFAEVNSDRVWWRWYGENRPVKMLAFETDTIGNLISTKAVGSFTREDITDNYKHKEKSRLERQTMLKALQMNKTEFSRYYLNEKMPEVEFRLDVLDDVVIGQPFTVKLSARNKNEKHKSFRLFVHLMVESTLYTGECGKPVKKQSFNVDLDPKSEQSVAMSVMYSEYERQLQDQSAFHIVAFAKVLETDYEFHGHSEFRVRMPDIIIKVDDHIFEGREFRVETYFTNPLPKNLRRGEFTLDIPGVAEILKAKLKDQVKPGEEARAIFHATVPNEGNITLVAKFISRELGDVDGFRAIEVKQDKGPSTTM